jgi:hypothetical protein
MGPNGHWTVVAVSTVLAFLIVLLFVFAGSLFPQWKGLSEEGLWLLVAFPTLISPLVFTSAMWQTRREQAVLLLLPGAPRRASINGWLSMRFAMQHLGNALVVGVTLLVLEALGVLSGRSATDREIALCVLVLSPLVPIAYWRDWLRMQAPWGHLTLRDGVIVCAIVGLALTRVAWERAPWWVLGALSATLSIPLALWRWRAIGREPAAWPVGRS